MKQQLFTFGIVPAALLGAVALTFLVTSPAFAEGASCAKTRITNIHYQCDDPGADCGGNNCVCRDVTNGFWSDCWCLEASVRGGGSSCKGGGKWWVKKTGDLAVANSCAFFQLVAHADNRLDFFEDEMIDAEGFVEGGASFRRDVVGGFQVCVGDIEDPRSVPVFLTAGTGTIPSMQVLGFATGTNRVSLGGEVPAQGVMDLELGTIAFHQGIPLEIRNSLFTLPFSTNLTLSTEDGGDTYQALISGGGFVGEDDVPAAPIPDIIYGNVDGCRIVVEGTELKFRGCNVHVENGEGSTGTVNGVGNLVLGYNEGGADLNRNGSHNLVVGTGHRYASYAGMVTGRANRLLAPYANAIGGVGNSAAHDGLVLGGRANRSSGRAATVLGGYGNVAAGRFSTTAAGQGSVATGDYGAVFDGEDLGLLSACVAEAKDAIDQLQAGLATLASNTDGGFLEVHQRIDALSQLMGEVLPQL